MRREWSRRTKLFGIDSEIYDRFMVPLIFEVYARGLARPAGESRRHRICWKQLPERGVLTAGGSPRGSPVSTRITATDLNHAACYELRKRRGAVQLTAGIASETG